MMTPPEKKFVNTWDVTEIGWATDDVSENHDAWQYLKEISDIGGLTLVASFPMTTLRFRLIAAPTHAMRTQCARHQTLGPVCVQATTLKLPPPFLIHRSVRRK